jgi:serine O-acetyltransferase
MFQNFKEDIKRYTVLEKRCVDVYLLFEQGLWAVGVYRFGRWVHRIKIPVIGFLLRFVAYLLFKIIEVVTGISIPASAQIGKGFYVGHFGNIILHTNVRMGENCSIGPGVIIGTRGLGDEGVPTIGNNVYIGTGAKIFGDIKIGDNVRVGANAVVISDVPSGTTAVGMPAKIITSREAASARIPAKILKMLTCLHISSMESMTLALEGAVLL